MVESSIAFQTGMLLMKSGVCLNRWAIGAVEGNFDYFFLEAGLVEDVLQLCALPARAAHCAIAPLHALHVRFRQAAPVARALIDGDHFKGRHLLQIVEGNLNGAIGTITADRDFIGRGIHLRNIR